MTTKLARAAALSSIRRFLKPIVRFCIRHAVRFQDVQELLKQAYIEVGQEESPGSVSLSRLSALSGLQRKDITRLLSAPRDDNFTNLPARDLVTKVVGQWQTDATFRTSKGEPRVLPYSEDKLSFCSLVKSVSSDVNPATVKAELLRCGIIDDSARGLRLMIGSFAPRGDVDHGLSVLEDDMRDLLRSVEENLFSGVSIANLHARTEYDKVREDALEDIRAWILREGHKFHQSAREYISQFDQDINPKKNHGGKTARVVVSAFSLTEVPK